MRLICETCGYWIGSFDPSDLSAPFRGDMFKPRAKGFPNPFLPNAGFLNLMCPVSSGGHRAMLRDNAVMTTGGLYEVGGDIPVEPSTDPGVRAAEERQKKIDDAWAEVEGGCDEPDAIFIKTGEPEETTHITAVETAWPPEKEWICAKCGKQYKTEVWLGKHLEKCKEKGK